MASEGEFQIEKEIRLVMVGKTGCGKSSLGNSLLAKHNPKKFESERSLSAVTQCCKKGQKVTNGNELLVIIDTPGLFDSTQPNDKILEEIAKCFSLTAPGPHALLFVLTARRLSEEEVQTIEILKKTFGPEVMNHVIVVFTGKDELEEDDITIENFVRTGPDYLKRLLSDCKNRYVAICNKPNKKSHTESVNDVMEMIHSVIRDNGGGYYTDAMFQKAEAFIKKEEEKLRAKQEAEEKRKHEEHLAALKTMEEKIQAEKRQQTLNEIEIGKLKAEEKRKDEEHLAALKSKEEKIEAEKMLMSAQNLRQQTLNEIEISKLKAEEKRKHEEHLATLKTMEMKFQAEKMLSMHMSMMNTQNQMSLRQQVLNEVEIGRLKDENLRREIEKNKGYCTIS